LNGKTPFEDAASVLGTTVAELQARLTVAGRSLGAPWQRDHREAAAAALVALRTAT
jgi:hypothetical protein